MTPTAHNTTPRTLPRTTRTLLLLDVDGVLVHPVGYKEALRATVDYFAAQMGQPSVRLSYDEIAVFEACGLTNEWDSVAMCVSELLLAALERRPELRRETLHATFAAIRAAGLRLPRPDFTAPARAIARAQADSVHPARVHLQLLAERTSSAHLPLLEALLGNVYDVLGAPTTRVFQAHTLGSERFAATYGQAAPLTLESYLAQRDRPLLSAESRARLLDWAAAAENGAVVYTARPSLPPADLPAHMSAGAPPSGYAPEAELAVELLGVAHELPLIGQGRVGWLAWYKKRDTAHYIKPSPVQALAALGAAVSGSETEALLAAAALVEEGRLTGPLSALRERALRVVVFEDSTGGIRATQRAAELLRRAGVDVSFEAVGVSPHADKRAALAEWTPHVLDEINAGLARVLNN